jgi:hypothetical protein
MNAETVRLSGPARRAFGGLIVVPAVLFIVAGLFGDPGAADHARMHAMMAAVSALVAFGIAARWPAAGLAAVAPATGFAAYALAQVIESVGALGYDTIRDTRSDLAVAHAIGMGATLIGMLAIVVGVTVGLALASARLRGPARLLGGASSLAVLIAGFLFVKVLIGM